MDSNVNQLPLSFLEICLENNKGLENNLRPTNGLANKMIAEDRSFHDWYRFVLSYPPHLVRYYINKFGLDHNSAILDPFCGTGTTLVEAKLNGIRSIGIEANVFPHFASSVKLDWKISPDILLTRAKEIAIMADSILKTEGIDDNSPFTNEMGLPKLRTIGEAEQKLLLTNSISPLPLHKTLVFLDCLEIAKNDPHYNHFLLAFANILVSKISNLRFGPEVGVGKIKFDVPIIDNWLGEIEKISKDICSVNSKIFPTAEIFLADARDLRFIQDNSIDAVITSPPYPNEKDYTRTTRLESVLLGFINNKEDLRNLKKRLVRSNTRGVYKGDNDDQWVLGFPEIQSIAEEIENRRIELGKDSGFERMYGKVTRLYFGGMAKHLAELRRILRPGAQLAYVVGDQASYLRIMIRTGKLLADIATSLGYELVDIDLFRTRMATATKEQLREEVVLLRWNG
jgi:DNA modification methylase